MQAGAVNGLHLVVDDIVTAPEALVVRGVDMGEIDDMGGIKYAAFSDPDGNTWTLQETRQYGEYRTKRLMPAAWDAREEG